MPPAQLTGAWRRHGIAAGSAPRSEDSRVIWLQTPSRYADIRVPADDTSSTVAATISVEAFAGRQRWQEPNLTFFHELDLTNNYPDDQGELSWDGETLIETGSVQVDGDVIGYREYWQRLTPLDPDYESWEIRQADKLLAIALKVDGHACIISDRGQFGAAYFTRKAGAWRQQWNSGVTPANPFAEGFSLPWRLVERAMPPDADDAPAR